MGEPAGDVFPDDVKPGAVLDVTGETAKFILATCGSMPTDSVVPQFQIAKVSAAVVTGEAPVPTPHEMSDGELLLLAGQTDSAFYDEWGGVKVRVKNQTPVLVTPTGGSQPGVVGDFGVITLQNSARVVDKLYFQSELAALMDPCHKGPTYSDSNTLFAQIDGFVQLDICTWGLAPANRCVDLQPPSDDCAGNSCP